MNRSKRRGATLVELMVSSSLTILVLVTSVMLFLFGLATWLRGQARIDANGTSEHAVREMSNALREAMSVTVDGDGKGLTYQLPSKDGGGAYNQPLVYDGVPRRFYLDNTGNIQASVNGAANHKICKFVITTDPLNNATYKLFTPGAGAITRQVTIMVVTKRSNYEKENVTSRSRETTFLRNVPTLTR